MHPPRLDHDAIVDAHAQGMSYAEICKEFGCSKSSVARILKLAHHKRGGTVGRPPGKTSLSDEEIETYRKMHHDQGMAIHAIARNSPRSPDAIRRAFMIKDIKIIDRSELTANGPSTDELKRLNAEARAYHLTQPLLINGASSLVG